MSDDKLKTRTVKNSCNPEWNDELTLAITDPNIPIKITVYDKDRFTNDDKMGKAQLDIKPFLECLRMGLEVASSGSVVRKIHPNSENCLAAESLVVWTDGKPVQDMNLRLRDTDSGEIEIQIEWIDVAGARVLYAHPVMASRLVLC
ncbi:C2-DOMAIN ABA-RELATED 7-like protein [Drosera capensis]